MKVFWSDREGNHPPSDAIFYLYPFSGKMQKGKGEQMALPLPQKAQVLKRTFFPHKEKWLQLVEKALQLIDKGVIEKIVLARTCVIELDQAPNPFAITASLKEKSAGAFLFCVEEGQGAFLGASPERLFARKHRTIISEAVAGTRPRGKDQKEDERLKNELLRSEKDRREIIPVQTYLKTHLAPFCSFEPLLTPLSVHQTSSVQHLYTQCSSELKTEVKDETILLELHPTPALCGAPKEKAFEWIEELEPFERGLYGGVIGWTTEKESDWTVAIRSCYLEGKYATLYSGTGIVKGSDPEKEWEELDQKLALYDTIFTD